MESCSPNSSCCVSAHRCRCFETLSEDERDFLYSNSVIVKYKKHETIFKQGSMASQVMFMEEGLAKVFIQNEINTLVLKIIPDGNFIGLTSISEDNNTHQYSAMTYVDSRIRQFEITKVRALIRQNSNFAKEVVDILNSNSLQIYSRFFCLTFKQAYGRLADILLCLSERIFKQTEFDLPLNRKELAELTGLSSETVIRLLKRFTDEGIVSMEGKVFKVLDYDRLKSISEKG